MDREGDKIRKLKRGLWDNVHARIFIVYQDARSRTYDGGSKHITLALRNASLA